MLVIRKPHIERAEQQSGEHPQFHERKGLAGAGILSNEEGVECFLVRDEMRLCGPAFGDEGCGVREITGV